MAETPQPQSREPAAKSREMQGQAVRASPVALNSWTEWARGLAIAAAAGIFLAIVGAFGTAETSFAMRLLYWVPVMLLGAGQGRLTAALVGRIPRATANEWVYGALLAITIAAPASLFIWYYTSFFFGMRLQLATLPYFAGAVLVISAAMTAIMMLAGRPGRVTHARAVTSAPAPAPRFLERLPPKLKGGALYAVQAEDHYLRLHTSKGSDLILMRLADAIVELEGLEGAQVHRSWWVAREGVESAAREGDRVTLKLKNGAEAPVSRPNVRPLREADWL